MIQTHRGLTAEGSGSFAERRGPLETSMLDLEFAHLSDCGRVRGHNEDYLGYVVPATPRQVRTHGWLFALADGVGGQERGEVASRTAVESLLAGFRASAGGDLHTTLLPRLVQEANVRVYEAGRAASAGGVHMATTLVACALRFDRAAVAHVGDSRCYLIRRGHAKLLTRDHTVASEHVRLGLLSAQDAAEAPTRHLLTRSLGTELFVGVETSDNQVLAGDVLLLCSDGLHGAVRASEMAHLVSHGGDLNAAGQKLVALANQRDGSDNISVLLIRVRSVERVGMYRGRPYRLR
ncbi:MAG TPA: protein phosphatase 2C domain-containing protein [Terracidiphilus sp.]|jgi:protein phosphatase